MDIVSSVTGTSELHAKMRVGPHQIKYRLRMQFNKTHTKIYLWELVQMVQQGEGQKKTSNIQEQQDGFTVFYFVSMLFC